MPSSDWWIRIPPAGITLVAVGATPCSASHRGRCCPATLPAGHQRSARSSSAPPPASAARSPMRSRPSRTGSPGSGTFSTPAARAIAATAQRAWWVASPPNLTGERTPSPAAQMRSQPTTRRVVAGEDEAVVVGRQSVERGPEQAGDGDDPVPFQSLASGLEYERALVNVRHDAGLDRHARSCELLGDRGDGLDPEERERCGFRRHDRHLDVVMAHAAGLAGGHQRELVGRKWPGRPSRYHDGEPLCIALLEVAQQPAVSFGVPVRPPRERARRPGDRACSGRHEECVERSRPAVS